MSKSSTRRALARAKTRAAREASQRSPGTNSNHARKKAFLHGQTFREADAEGKPGPAPADRPTDRVFGFDIPDPKPWK